MRPTVHRRPTIGIDFDNTLVTYDEVMRKVSMELGLTQPETVGGKRSIRDTIRLLPNGDIGWQKVQGIAYGPKSAEAAPADGTDGFLRACAKHGVKVYIVSHKTEFADYDDSHTNLRCAAMSWMEGHDYFDAGKHALSRGDVFFEWTRAEKLERIRQLGCTHFIDDLVETFLEESFPTNVEKILYAPYPPSTNLSGVTVAATWDLITGHLFDATS